MERGDFDAHMRAIVDATAAGNHRQAASRALEVEATLRGEPDPDAAQLGWARFYAFRTAYALGDAQRAYDLLVSASPDRYAIDAANRAWMCSVGAELAFELGKLDDIARWGERCYALRRGLGSIPCALRCALHVCELLSRAGTLSDHPRWPRRVIEIGRRFSASVVVAAGERYAQKGADPVDPLARRQRRTR